MKSESSAKPWKRPNPKKKNQHTALTPASKARAKAAAAKAGRRYPNMVDNMNAAKAQNQRSHEKSAAKKS